MTAQQRKIILTITVTYTILILYFMLLAFGRADNASRGTGYTFIFMPEDFFRLPGLSDLLRPTLIDIVSFGNIAAFIPFGILIPWLYRRIGFMRFMALFVLSILVVETVQALTLLGSFDMNDVIQNSVGAAIGFGAYKLGFRTRHFWRNIAITGLSAVVLMIVVWGTFGLVDKVFAKEMGPFVALNDLRDGTGNPSTGTGRYNFIIGGEHIEPQYNVYRAEDNDRETYSYQLGNKELYLYFNYGVPDEEDVHGSLSVTVDGEELLSASVGDQRHELNMSSIYLERGHELTIIIKGNVKLWDVGFREMSYSWNRGEES
ncbi:hypothetical protein J41TS12_04630 [Paenibacillus antibioticophila]|uniref:VanZ-like domain-containing protein n=1 Tax=Paenibacillus antibioticophila TaxID=1274374 RepID=A0A919XRY3_9BACL|nr:VanZ family protein [Paenibacillus antibioticophila]GIO35602.1 hypothetical protein J41TS12_04630 [Paenibacillus antibioticophila]